MAGPRKKVILEEVFPCSFHLYKATGNVAQMVLGKLVRVILIFGWEKQIYSLDFFFSLP